VAVRCAVVPTDRRPWLADAARAGGADIVDLNDAEALIWADPGGPAALRDTLDRHPAIRWVQLPWAGIEPFVDVLDDDHVWTCGKGVYAEPVAEHALALALTLLRATGRYARRRTWDDAKVGRNLLGARVTILGGGEITRSLLRLLAPFGVTATVVRRHPEPMDGAVEVVGADALHAALDGADLVVLALALTPETERILDGAALAALPEHAVVVNVARGQHIDTDALVAALDAGTIGGAGLDVTDPEPLPDGHPLWDRDDVVITPHVGNTPEMAVPLLSERVTANVRRYAAGEPLLGPVHVDLGY
jgi:phosphoglycerate dehydrogenase-like enzyme